MANEVTLITKFSDAVDFVCADGTGIEKGTILKIADGRVVAASSADGDFFIGIAAREKIASDGRTSISVYLDGIFDIKTVASPAAIAAGEPVKIAGANLIDAADDDTIENAGEVVGKALETVSATTQETINVLIGRGAI